MSNNIYSIAYEIFMQEPQPPNSIQIEIMNNNNPAIIFEIASILFCECIELKLPRLLRNERNINDFILQLKQYFQSFGMDFNYQHLTDYPGSFNNSLSFQLGKTYFFQMRTEFRYYDFLIYYEHDVHESNNLTDYVLILKLFDNYYHVSFKFLR